MAGHPAPGAWFCCVGRFHSRRWAVPWGLKECAPEFRPKGDAPQGLLFALKCVLASGAAFPVLGNCPCHLPATVGSPSLRGLPSPGAAPWAPPHLGPHLWPLFASPRQAFLLDPLGPPASFPSAGISPSPLHLLITSKGVTPPPRPLLLTRLASATLRVATLFPACASLPPRS